MTISTTAAFSRAFAEDPVLLESTEEMAAAFSYMNNLGGVILMNILPQGRRTTAAATWFSGWASTAAGANH
jgi:hypothetical protein